MSDPLTQYYADNPWETITATERDWYVPILLNKWRRQSIYKSFVPHLESMAAVRAGNKMIFTGLYNAPITKSPISEHTLWTSSLPINSYVVEIQAAIYGGKISVHEDDMDTSFWQDSLPNVCKGKLGENMVNTLDELMRDAFLTDAPYTYYAGSQTGVADLTSSHTFDLDQGAKSWIHLAERPFPVDIAMDPTGGWNGVVAIVSPRQYYDIMTSAGNDWVGLMKYADSARALRFEVVSYKGVRYIKSDINMLRCRGAVIHSTTLSAAASAGDGAAASFDKVYKPSQKTGATIFVTVADASGFSVGDWVVICDSSVSHPTHATDPIEELRIESISGNQLRFHKPLDFNWDSGDKVIKAYNAHAAIFIAGLDGVIGAVYYPPRVMAPQPVDDFQSQYRFTWKARLKYQQYAPEQFEVYWTGGSTV